MGDKEDKVREDKLKQFETTARYHVHCEERAFHIVNKLIDGQFDAEYLLECCKLINREHYDDIVEERAITLLCGYPLCGQSLRDIPKKKYHISTKTNRVFDISERKNFCSNQCLKASKWLENQLPDSPVWAREGEELKPIQLLPHTQTRGMIGEQVVGMSLKRMLEAEMAELKLLDQKSPADKQKQSSEFKPKKRDDFKRTEEHNEGGTNIQVVENKSKKSDKNNLGNTSALLLPNSANGKEDGKLCKDFKNLSVHACRVLEVDTEINFSKDKLDKLDVNEEKVQASSVNLDDGILVSELRNELKNDSISSSLEMVHPAQISLKKQEQEVSGTNFSENTKQPKDAEKSQTAPSKMEQLKMLMTKKKHMLSQMVDIQDNPVKSSIHVKSASQENESREISVNKDSFTETEERCTGHDSSLSTKSMVKTLSKTSNACALSPLRHLSIIIGSWTNERTKLFLNAESSQEANAPTFSDPNIQQGYANICSTLNRQEEKLSEILEGTECRGDEKKRILKSAPEYKALKRETEAYQKSVSEFITGKKSMQKGEEDEEKAEVYLPTVDAYDQMQIRSKIVLERLYKSVPELLVPLDLSIQDVSTLIRQLIYTFSLDKDSIVLKPMQWMLAGLLILKMLSTRYQHIRDAFNTDTANRYFTVLLKGIGHTPADLDHIIDHILSEK